MKPTQHQRRQQKAIRNSHSVQTSKAWARKGLKKLMKPEGKQS